MIRTNLVFEAALHFSHYLQVLESVARGVGLSHFRRLPGALADGDRQSRQLDQALELPRVGLLVDVNVSDLELLLGGDLLQELDEVDALVAQASFLQFDSNIGD